MKFTVRLASNGDFQKSASPVGMALKTTGLFSLYRLSMLNVVYIPTKESG
jgi:hypothetical protein